MSTSSVKPVPTLKGVFSAPKMNHRRDFLRENKLNLRELQRTTIKKQSSTQQELQKQFRTPPQQQQLYPNRRSASQQRGAAVVPPPKQNPARSISQQRRNSQTRQENLPRCPSCSGGGGVRGRDAVDVASVASKESCDKEIQTDDIHDEAFLYDALKKCTASELNCDFNSKLHSRQDRSSKSEPNVPHLRHLDSHNQADYQPNGCYQEEKQAQDYHRYQHHHADHNQADYQVGGSYQEQKPQQDYYHQQQDNTARNHNQQQCNIKEQHNPTAPASVRSQQQQHANGHVNNGDEDMNLNFGNLAIDNQGVGQTHVHNAPLSSRSRHTVCSTQSNEGLLTKKKSSGSLHKFGSRDDVRLPRYLEREKRDKEEQRMREMVRDPNCPLGHFALTNDERLSALATAEKKFKSLVSELNHMPMTTETLRIRLRKAEIEKELVVLESDIRIFSKSKVYVKQPEQED